MTTLEIQQRLKALGFDPGPLDGAWGPKTRAAVKAFQRSANLVQDGVVGLKTIAAFNAHAPAGANKVELGEPVWVQEGRRMLGLHEQSDNAALRAYLKSDGQTLGDPAKLPWCGDFVETVIRRALPNEPIPTNPYLARNWLKFGVTCPEPVVGAIAVFWRGSKAGTSGHVGFVVGADASYLSILGGNQSNSVSVARLDRSRLLGCRWPATAGPIVATKMGAAVGAITTNEA